MREVVLMPREVYFADNLAEAEDRLLRLAAGDVVTYTLEIAAADGSTLATRPIVADRAFDTDSPMATFMEVIAWPVNGTKVLLKSGGAALDNRQASAHPPEVTLLYPNGGESFGSQDTIRWTASDSDGDDLLFHILYSADAGEHWRVVEQDLDGREYQLWPGESLPGSDEALMRIVATDGFRTAQDDSDGTFTVSGAAPLVHIGSPADGASLSLGRPVILDGVADDVEDGLLAEESLRWTSDLDGALGTGGDVYLPEGTLSVGRHLITLVATDSDGMSFSASVSVTVGEHRVHLPCVLK